MAQMDDKTGIIGFCHCSECRAELPDHVVMDEYSHLDIGLTDPQTLRIWCKRHGLVADFKLAEPLKNLRCSECGEQLGPGHHH